MPACKPLLVLSLLLVVEQSLQLEFESFGGSENPPNFEELENLQELLKIFEQPVFKQFIAESQCTSQDKENIMSCISEDSMFREIAQSFADSSEESEEDREFLPGIDMDQLHEPEAIIAAAKRDCAEFQGAYGCFDSRMENATDGCVPIGATVARQLQGVVCSESFYEAVREEGPCLANLQAVDRDFVKACMNDTIFSGKNPFEFENGNPFESDTPPNATAITDLFQTAMQTMCDLVSSSQTCFDQALKPCGTKLATHAGKLMKDLINVITAGVCTW